MPPSSRRHQGKGRLASDDIFGHTRWGYAVIRGQLKEPGGVKPTA